MRGRIRIAAVGLVAVDGRCAPCRRRPARRASHVERAVQRWLRVARPPQHPAIRRRRLGGRRQQRAAGRGVRHRRLPLDGRRRPTRARRAPTSSLSGVALDATQDAVAKGAGVTATPTGSSSCTVPIDTGLINVNVSCGTASASEDANGNPTASGTGSLANVSISLSLTDVLQSLLGGSLPLGLVGVQRRPGRLGRRRLQHRTRWRPRCSRC